MLEGGAAPSFCSKALGFAAFLPKQASARAHFNSANCGAGWGGRSMLALRLGNRSGGVCARMCAHLWGLCQRSSLPRMSHQVSAICVFPYSDPSARSPSHSTLHSSPRITSSMKPSLTTQPHPAQSALLMPPGTLSVPNSIHPPGSAGSLVPRPR